MSKDNYESVFSYPLFTDLTAKLTGADGPFDTLFARSGRVVSLAGIGEPKIVGAELVSGTYFDALGLRAIVGASALPMTTRPREHPVVVLSNAHWLEHFGGRREIVGQTLRVNNQPMEIIGASSGNG